MKAVYRNTERGFEKLTSIVSAIMGNSVTFIIALCIVLFWLSNKIFFQQDIHDSIRDVILGVTFLSLFIIQKSFNRFSASLQLKLNELVASHEQASNKLINIEEKTEHELNELSKEYTELATLAKSEEEKKEVDSEKNELLNPS
jgi:low affinity Fe/Cu permease